MCAALVVLLGLFRLLVFTDVFHTMEQRRLGIAARFPQASPAEVTDQLQDYFRADGSQLIDSELFSYRERLHYREVKQLIERANGLLAGAGVALAGLALGLAYTARGRSGGTTGVVASVCGRVAAILIVVIAICAALGLSFDTSFVRLHFLLFDSRNWILPPYSASARLFPLRYFIDFLLAFSGLVLGAAAVFLAAGAWLKGQRKTTVSG